jgi:hypothetical protein
MEREKRLLMNKTGLLIDKKADVKFNLLLTVLIGILIISSLSFISAGYTRTNNYHALGGIGSFAGGFFGETPGQFDRSMCEAGQDFVLQMAPLGCTPAVVRSDLLEEQNVPVYCQIAATQINPLVDVKAIDYITFSGQTPKEVAGVGFNPNKAALGTGRSTTLDNYPVLENIGSAVIVLKRQPNESALTNCMDSKLLGLDVGEVCVVEGNLTAKIKYNIENAFGVGQATYYLPLIDSNEFDNGRYKSYGFWDGRGFLKAENIEKDGATISIYSGKTGYTGNLQKTNTVSLKEGATSEKIYMTGFNYCLANMRIRLDDITFPDTRARIKVNSDVQEVAEDETFLDGKCEVLSMDKYGLNERVEIKCKEDQGSGLFGSKAFTLKTAPKVELEVNGQSRSMGLGDFVEKTSDGKSIYVGYIGSEKNTNKKEDLQVIFIALTEAIQTLDENTLEEISTRLGPLYEDSTSPNNVFNLIATGVKRAGASVYEVGRSAVTEESIDRVTYSKEKEIFKDTKGNTNIIKIKIKDFSGAVNAELDKDTLTSYQKAIDDYDEVLKSFASENYGSNNIGKETFFRKIYFAEQMQQRRTMIDLCKEFSEAYPNEIAPETCSDALKLSSDVSSVRSVTINGKVKEISFNGIYEPSYDEYSVEGYARKIGDASSAPVQFVLRNNEIFYLETPVTDTASTLFTIDRGASSNSLWFKYEDNIWKWATTSTFYPVTQIPSDYTKAGITGGQMLTSANIDLIKALASDKGKSFEEGKKLIIETGGKLSVPSTSTTATYIKLGTIKDESNVDILAIGTARSAGFERAVSFKKGIPQAGIGNYEVTIQKINLKRVAKVSVLPNIDYSGTETTFKFKIGIEKRSDLMKLSPDKAQDKIKSIDEDVKKLDKISSDLGNVVTGLKTACLATGAIFTIDNLLSNLNGKGLARQKVMRDPNGWYDQCNKWVREKTLIDGEVYSTLQDCLFENSDKIDAEVDKYYKTLTEQNNEIENIDKANIIKSGGLFSEDVVDSTGLIKDYSVKVSSDLASCSSAEITNPLKSSEKIKIKDIQEALSFKIWNKSKNYNFEELRDVGFYCNVLKTNPGDARAQQKLYSLLSNVNVNSKEIVQRDTFLDEFGLSPGEGGSISTRKDIKSVEFSTLKTWVQVKGKFTQVIGSVPVNLMAFKGRATSASTEITMDLSPKDAEYVYLLTDISNNKKYMLVLDNSYVVDRTFEIQGNNLFINTDAVNPLALQFKKVDSSSYSNKYNNPEVKYFETEPFKGAPALVPLDTQKGWYVAMSQTLPGFGNVRSFDESGRVYSYYLGNTGTNGNVDFFEGGGDDISQLVVLGSKETFSRFSGLSDSEVASLVRKAEEAILSVQKQYPSIVGKANAHVKVPGIAESIKVGSPSANVPSVECEDFMSPGQCQILFNVCDPVICPSSRCNLGGAYPVADVVQSGVIGSIALCLPNINEGIGMPVCLTGVKAGLDNWVSIQKSYRDCLREQIDTGKTVGICDEIQSIYMCEFFWRQSLPVAKIAIPAVLSSALGQGTRGGGEYLGVANAWENAEKSVTYFTQYYADDSFKAFKARSTDEVGGEFCKNFASGVYPNSGNLLDSLTQADSPPQFTGRFDEIPFTTATNPPVSQYKVFYHIFAGKDTGAYYRVYLKGAPRSSYYDDTAMSRVVGYGYVQKGGYNSSTVDFTAPSGYSQMCILVNGQEECGFKQVSTDFTVNYVKDQYLKEQSTTNVKSEAECISGTPSLYSMLNPNLQEGVSNTVNPDLYNQGIYRICATNNPGQGTDGLLNTENQRWVEVGYCGNTKIKCWLDMQSVNDNIRNLDIRNGTVEAINAQAQADLNAKGNAPDFESTLTGIENTRDNNEKISKINDVIGKFFYNYQKGWLLMTRGDVYSKLAFELFKKKNDEKTTTTETTATATPKDEISKILEEQHQEISKIGIISPIFAYNYGGGLGLFKNTIYYSYSGNNWYWSIDKQKWYQAVSAGASGLKTGQDATTVEIVPALSQEIKEFTSSLSDQTIQQGIDILMKATRANTGKGILSNVELFTNKVSFSQEGIFTVKQATPIYFEFGIANEWTYMGGSTDEKIWKSVSSEIFLVGLDSTVEREANLIKSLIGKNDIDGALIIFGINAADFGTPASSGETTPSGLVCSTQEECQKALGKEIVLAAREIKKENEIDSEDDRKITEQTGAKNFECLILQLAYQESKIRQCGKIVNGNIIDYERDGDPLYCNGNIDGVLSGDNGNSKGIMQINIGEHPTIQVQEFSENIKFGINYLINKYNPNPKVYDCYRSSIFVGPVRETDFSKVSYSDWKRALRGYNGWNTQCLQTNADKSLKLDSHGNFLLVGDPAYVDNVLNNKDEVEALFPETCSGSTSLSSQSSSSLNTQNLKVNPFLEKDQNPADNLIGV